MKIAKDSINKTKEFFKSLDIPATLREVGIKEDKLEEMAKQATRNGTVGNFKPLHSEDVLRIFRAAF